LGAPRGRYVLSAISATSPDAEAERRSGFGAGLGAYILWGFLPLLFHLLEPVGAVAIVANRTIWSLLFVGVILLAGRRIGEVKAALSDWPTLRSMMISSVLLVVNWLIYVWAVGEGQVLEGSFGYFINPLVNVAIGMIFLGERQNRWQMVSILIAVVAIGIQWLGIGRIPFIALGLALSFGFYGFFRKTAKVGSTSGLFVETLILVPLAVLYLVWIFMQQGGLGVQGEPFYLTTLILTGPATAVPLLLFAGAAARVPLSQLGVLFYLNPTMQFLIGVLVKHEPLSTGRAVGFALVWVALIVFTADSLTHNRRRQIALTAEASAA